MDVSTDWVVSDGRYALDFDGTNDLVAALTPFGAIAQPRLTAACWVRLNSGYGLLSICNGSTGFFWYAGLSGSAVPQQRLYIGTTPFPGLNSSTAVPTGWNHLAFTFDNNAITFYLNGRPDGTATGVASPNFGGAAFNLGGFGGSESLNGQLAEYWLFARGLSPAEIRLLATRRGIAFERRKRRSVFFDAAFFNPAWARNSNVILSPVGAA